MAILDNETLKYLKEEYAKYLKDSVTLEVFVNLEKAEKESIETGINKFTVEFFKEFETVSDKIKYIVYDVSKEEIKKYLLDRKVIVDEIADELSPVITFKKYPNIIYLGFPLYQEFEVFLEDILHVSNDSPHISPTNEKKVSEINKELYIYVFVTATCPYCPLMTHLAHQVAMINQNIKGVMIMSEFFNNFAEKYNVYAVPRVVIRDKEKVLNEWEGAVHENIFIQKLVEAANK